MGGRGLDSFRTIEGRGGKQQTWVLQNVGNVRAY